MSQRAQEIERFASTVRSSKLVQGFVVPEREDIEPSIRPWIGNVKAKRNSTFQPVQLSKFSADSTDRFMQKRLTLISEQVTNNALPISAQISARYSRSDVINRQLYDGPSNPALDYLFNGAYIGPNNNAGGLRPFPVPYGHA